MPSEPRQISVKPVRVLADGPYVAVHFETMLPSGDTTSWDIFRFEQGKIVEHWDTRQPIAPPNGAGHTELDGPTTVTDLAATESNKRLAWTAIATVFRDGELSQYGEPIWNAAGYIQHSEGMNADGIGGSKPLVEQFIGSGSLVYAKINKVIAVGGPDPRCVAAGGGQPGPVGRDRYRVHGAVAGARFHQKSILYR